LLTTSLRYQFNQAVRVKSIVVHTADSQEGPKLIKLLINRSALGFEDVDDAEEPEAALVQELPEDTVKEGQQIDLKFVRFQSVTSLHVSETFLNIFLTLTHRNIPKSLMPYITLPRSLSVPIRVVKRQLE
jgi:hypothetical protein